MEATSPDAKDDDRVKADNVLDDPALAHPAMAFAYEDPINSNQIDYAIEGTKNLDKAKGEENNQAKDLLPDDYLHTIVSASQKDMDHNESTRAVEPFPMSEDETEKEATDSNNTISFHHTVSVDL